MCLAQFLLYCKLSLAFSRFFSILPYNYLFFMLSRRRSREFLLQSLYARSELGETFDRDIFTASFFSDENSFTLETGYVDLIEHSIFSHEKDLIEIIALLAPKFELSTIPVIHILILMITLSELLYASDLSIPEAVAVNEAIELAKRFSDDQGRIFINGALSSFLKDKDNILTSLNPVEFRVFV